jgi:hypothetical protein
MSNVKEEEAVSKLQCRTEPCETCPYRRDVPSGVWMAHEYEKLTEYDKPTGEQPPSIFYCHTSTDFVCTGWAQCHDRNPRGHELLALRFAAMCDRVLKIPKRTVALFKSGAEAAAHGLREIEAPGRRAIRAVEKVAAARERKARRKG